eukprot:Clim_evm44s239 gene=Clim_evmTU44s239
MGPQEIKIKLGRKHHKGLSGTVDSTWIFYKILGIACFACIAVLYVRDQIFASCTAPDAGPTVGPPCSSYAIGSKQDDVALAAGRTHDLRLSYSLDRVDTTRKPFEDSIAVKAHGNLDLNDADRSLLGKYYSHIDSLLEWGVGESTEIAAYYGVPRYTGVDASETWLSHFRSITPSHFTFVWTDIGPIKSWGYPIDLEATPKFPRYSLGPLAMESDSFEVYFVNGRFRVACTLASFLHASLHGKSEDEYHVIVHDFRDRRSQYGVLLEVADRVEGCCGEDAHNEKMIVLRKKKHVTDATIRKLWEQYKAIPK